MSTMMEVPLWWVITDSEEAFGPYESPELAELFATINLGMSGWVITHT